MQEIIYVHEFYEHYDIYDTKTKVFIANNVLAKKRIKKSFQVHAFCEEKGLTPCLEVIWFAVNCGQEMAS